MPVQLEASRKQATPSPEALGRNNSAETVRIGLINNMPDSALQSTEAQFSGLLERAAGARPVTVRLSSFPELSRSAEAQARIQQSYWPLDELLAEPLDALIVTGTEPRAPRLADEPYWHRFGEVLDWAEANTRASIWSCLAAHAAVQSLDAIERQRLPEKRSGVYEHQTAAGDALLAGAPALLAMPHSRWNELSVDALRTAGYQMLSWSTANGADAFVRRRRSLMLFFQGHPEYEDTTLLKEYRRDVTRYVNSQQAHYPTLPHGYFSPSALEALERFRQTALADRRPELMDRFPFGDIAAGLKNTWRDSAVAIYRNWLMHIVNAKSATHAPEPVSLADS
jgi:homoserine O-succinyltransferase/O-acetyltransferase